MHESYTYYKWLKREQPEAELQGPPSVSPVYNLKISFPFILLLDDPIWQLHLPAERISHCSLIKGIHLS